MRIVRIAFLFLTVGTSASATTFLVPTDRKLIASSGAIVIAVAGESRGQMSSRETIETLTTLQVEESIRGPLRRDETFDVVELGGFIGDNGLAISGGARFRQGQRVLLFLAPDAGGRWHANNMTLGKFSFVGDLLLRDAREICGWDEDGKWHREPYRDAASFLRFVRGENVDYVVPRPASIQALPPQTDASVGSYLLETTFPPRWNTFPQSVVFLSNGTQPGAPGGGLTALQRGLAVWTNDGGSNVSLAYGGTTSRNSAFTHDGVNAAVFNDLSGEVPGAFPEGGVLAIGGVEIAGTHNYGGEILGTVVEAGLVVQNGITGRGLSGLGFDHVIAHELGHCIGLRHSDEPHSGGTFAVNALMASGVDFDFDPTGSALQAWDIEAVRAVYGSGGPPPPPCSPPAIAAQPQSVTLVSGSVSLSVQASGTTPFAYQWFEGSRGDTRSPVGGGTSPVISVTPARTTTYWVRVTGQCTPVADSEAATVTVNGCPAVVITSRSPDVSVIEGTTQTLSVGVNSGGRPVTYQWYAGARGNTSRPMGTDATLTVTPATSTPYWVQVTNDCGATASSETINITVRPCTAPRVVLQPANAQAILGGNATLAATISGTGPMQMQWYEGVPTDTSRPVSSATTASVVMPALFTQTMFWLRVANECGSVDTNAVTVSIVSSCTAPVIAVQPQNQTVLINSTAILTVGASGPSLTYRWYQGPVFDFTKPIGGSAPSLATNPINEPTEFWVLIQNPCGTASSVAATVSPSNPRRRAVGR